MKIAIMMRPMDADAGFRSIVEGMVESLLTVGKEHEYLLLYRTPKHYGRFAAHPNVTEVLLGPRSKLLWDQVAVPWRAWREGADVIYNPKFSVPLISHCPVTMGLHEPAQWAWPDHYEWFDRHYMRVALPLYIRKSRHLFPISQFVIEENRKHLSLPIDNTTVSYPAPRPYFRRVEDREALEAFRARLGLPERFVVCVTRVSHAGLDGSTSFFPGKNVETAVRAFNLLRRIVPHRLVIAGLRAREYLLDLGFMEDDLEGVHFAGFVPHEEMPLLLSLADLFVIPSFYESYAMALVEAMTCGCPVVAAQTGACPEITAGAALLADPYKAKDFAEKMGTVLADPELARTLSARSLERAAFFRWERTTTAMLEKFAEVAGARGR